MMDAVPLGRALVTASDCVVLAVLLAVMVGVGFYFRRRQTSTAEFFLGSRKVPGWAASLSFVATEVSAVTLISVPATAYRENWEYLQFFVGSAAARIVIATLFIPAFYKFNCTTIYQFLAARFGWGTQVAASFFFFLTRLLGSGVRLMAACLALSVLLGWNILPVVIVFISVGVLYMGVGGMRAVVWTNVLQAAVFMVGGLAAIVFLAGKIEGGLFGLFHVTRVGGHLSVFDWGPAIGAPDFLSDFFRNPNVFWVAILNGFVGSMAAFGTDQDLMQRLLTVETRRESQRTMLATIGLSLIVLLIYLTVGSGLYAFYSGHPAAALPSKLDAVFPHFIGHEMPSLLKGLLLSAIVLAGIDSPLASLATSFVTDVYRPLATRAGIVFDDHRLLSLSRVCVLGFGVVLAFLAWAFSFFDNILWLAFKIGGVTFGSLLGVFLLGLLTTRGRSATNIVAMIASAFLNLGFLLLSEKGILPLGWSWLVIFGTAVTFSLGYFLAPKGGRPIASGFRPHH
jgi:SSS family solute:Na+ symporter